VELMVNGKKRVVQQGATIAALLEEMKIDPLRVAVQLNLEIVRRERFAQTDLRAGDRLEIITFMAGGSR
jgi:thiamine biosynthesis protein ThiS